jgi:hypothetical protein
VPNAGWSVIGSRGDGFEDRAARSASARSTGQSGTSVSHSMSVGRGPPRDGVRVEGPDRIDHLAPVAVDQQGRAVVVLVLVMAAEMDLAHRVEGEGVDIGAGVGVWLVAETKTLLTSSRRPQPVRRAISERNVTSSMSLSAKAR